METTVWVAILGAAGVLSRYAFNLAIPGGLLPWPTLIVNLAGCFLGGVVYTLTESGTIPVEWRIRILGGYLGGFTTFSAFGIETFLLLLSREAFLAVAYVGISAVAGVFAAWAGFRLAQLV